MALTDAWERALDEWGDGPRTMKATADWANRWVHALRTDAERSSIELDATRARVAELEAKRAHETQHLLNCCAERDKALAAREAECAELRAALDHLLREWLAWQPGITGVARTRAEAALSRPPGSDAALRAMMVKSWEAGYLRGCGGCNPTDGPPWDEDDCRNRDAAIARLLPPPAEARDGGAR